MKVVFNPWANFGLGEDELYVGGRFTCTGVDTDCTGETILNGVAKWDGTAWQPLGGGIRKSFGTTGTVYALEATPYHLYVGGVFDRADGFDGLDVANIARWDFFSQEWQQLHTDAGLGPGVYGTVYALTTHGDDWMTIDSLYIGGRFPTASRTNGESFAVRNIARYDLGYETFHGVGGGLVGHYNNTSSGFVYALASHGTDVYAGGAFHYEYADPQECNPALANIARWDGSSWQPLAGGLYESNECDCTPGGATYPCGGRVEDLEVFGGHLYAAGGASGPYYVTRWDLSEMSWEIPPINNTWAGDVNVLEFFADEGEPFQKLHIGGDFRFDASTDFNRVARWDNPSWSALVDPSGEIGVDGPVYALAGFRDENVNALFVGGNFTSAGSQISYNVAKWAKVDSDGDSIFDLCDNCPLTPNGPGKGTCVRGLSGECTSDGDCETQAGAEDGRCRMDQSDPDGDGYGEPCDECEGGHNGFDSDGDGVPNACDNCSDTYNPSQLDSDEDGLGDACDEESIDLQLKRVRDLEGNILETFEYAGDELHFRYRGVPDPPSGHFLKTSYTYDGTGRLDTITHEPKDNTALTRTFEVSYDPERPESVIGTRASNCGCGGDQEFVYRDDRDRIVKSTTTSPACGEAEVVPLDEFEYKEQGFDNAEGVFVDENADGVIDDRMTAHRKRNADGQMVEVERRVYIGGPIGDYTAIVCRPRGNGQYDVTRRSYSYSGNGRVTKIWQYDEPQADCVDLGTTNGTLTEYHYTRFVDSAGQVTGETNTTVHPTGYRDVSSWHIQDDYFQVGSTRVHETYRESEASVRTNQRTETYDYVSELAGYRLAIVAEPNGRVIEYLYEDIGFPERVTAEIHSPPGGISTLPGSRMTYGYDGAGRVEFEIRAGPNWTGPAGTCTSAADAGCVTTQYLYDDFGRLTTNVAYVGNLYRISDHRYNAFDEEIVTRDGDSPGLVQARYYNEHGLVQYIYACEYSGLLSDFGDASSPPAGVEVLNQTFFEYHATSGRTTKEVVVLDDDPPFSFVSDPNTVTTAETESGYDCTGAWRISSTQPGLGSRSYEYDDQGRTTKTVSATGVIQRIEYNGRGLVTATISEASDGSVQPITTSTNYDADGQVELVTDTNGTYLRNVYDGFGRLYVQKRCDTADCSNDELVVPTTFQYDGAGNVTRQYTGGVSDTITHYDNFGRPFRTWHRANEGISDPNLDSITLSKYNAVGLVEASVQKLGANADAIEDYVDAVTEYEYDDLGQMTTTTTRNTTLIGGAELARDEITTAEYDTNGRLNKQTVCLDSMSCSGENALVTSFTHDALGRVTKTIDPDGHYIEHHYDSRGNLSRRESFDNGGLMLRQERWEYDAAGRLTRTAVMADATSTGDPDTIVDRVTEFTYDDDGRPLTTTRYAVADGVVAPQTSTNVYDGIGRLTDAIDPLGNVEKTYYLDGTNLIERREISDGRPTDLVISYGYDELGRLDEQSQTGDGTLIKTRFEYDAANRQTAIERLTAEDQGTGTYLRTEFGYDLIGLRTTVTEAAGTSAPRVTEYDYDRVGRLTKLTATDDEPAPAMEQVTSYGYDLVGNRTRITYPDAGEILMEYDSARRVANRTDPRGQVVDYLYDKRGLLTSRASDQGVTDEFTYDGLGRRITARRLVGGNEKSR